MKKVISILLSVVMLMSIIATTAITASAEESFYTATRLKVGYAVSGYCNDGAKYYKILAPERGKLNIKFNHQYSSDYAYWRIQLFKRNSDGLFDAYTGEIDVYASGSAYKFPSIGVNKGDVYYVKIWDRYNVSELEFILSASFTKTSYFETEFNDDFRTADLLHFDKTTSANVYYSDDYFKFAVPTSGTVYIKFNHQYSSDYAYWKVQLYKRNSDGLYDTYSDETEIYASEGVKYFTISNAKKGQVYYVKVWDRYNVGELTYSLTPTIKIHSPSTPSASVNKGRATIRWSKAYAASGYQVQISKYKSFKKSIKITQKSSKVVKNLSRNTRYYVRVRAYRKVGSKTYFSKWRTNAFKTK